MRSKVLGLTLASLVLTGCATEPAARRPEFSAGYPVYDCPQHLEGQVRLALDVYPLPGPLPSKAYSLRTVGEVGRRLAIGVDPAGLDRRDRIVWSSLSISSYGGTFTQWRRLKTEHVLVDPSATEESLVREAANSATGAAEIATVKGSAGQIRVTRIARGSTQLAGTYSIDMSVMPGGEVIDDTVLGDMRLWKTDGSPVPPADVKLELASIRHPPGLDRVQASAQLDYIVRLGASGEEWACSAEGRVTLVDQDAVRQAFWDLGLAPKNSSRREWLAVQSPQTGAIRLTFDSPAAANSFAAWLQTTRATAIGGYSIGAFTQKDIRADRPYGPLDAEAMRTYRPLQSKEFPDIKVGPVGEP